MEVRDGVCVPESSNVKMKIALYRSIFKGIVPKEILSGPQFSSFNSFYNNFQQFLAFIKRSILTLKKIFPWLA